MVNPGTAVMQPTYTINLLARWIAKVSAHLMKFFSFHALAIMIRTYGRQSNHYKPFRAGFHTEGGGPWNSPPPPLPQET